MREKQEEAEEEEGEEEENTGIWISYICVLVCVCVCVCSQCSVVSDSAAPWTEACQAPLSMGFSRQEYWSGLPFPDPEDLPNPVSPVSPALAGAFFTTAAPGKPICMCIDTYVFNHYLQISNKTVTKKTLSWLCKHKIWLPLWFSWLRICLQCRRPEFNPWVRKIPWRRERLPTPIFWPGEFLHGVAKSGTWLSDFHFSLSSIKLFTNEPFTVCLLCQDIFLLMKKTVKIK